MRAESYKRWSQSFASYLYRERNLKLWKCASLKATSRPGEREKQFRIRMTELTREKRDLELEKLKQRFTPKVTKLRDRIDKAQEKVSREESQYQHQKLQTAISFGATLLGALTGRKLGSSRTVGRATTTARTAGRAAREREDIARAKREVVRLKEKLVGLEEEFKEKVERLRELPAPSEIEIEEVSIRPRKSDISVSLMALAWKA
jgi:TolA-binding protein